MQITDFGFLGCSGMCFITLLLIGDPEEGSHLEFKIIRLNTAIPFSNFRLDDSFLIVYDSKTQSGACKGSIALPSYLAAVAHDQDNGWFNGFLEDSLNRISRRLTQYIFRTREQNIISGDEEGVNLLSPRRLRRGYLQILLARQPRSSF